MANNQTYFLGQYLSKETLENEKQYTYLEPVRSIEPARDLYLADFMTGNNDTGIDTGVSGINFHDVYIPFTRNDSSRGLSTSSSYYCVLQIPQDVSYHYDLEFQLLLDDNKPFNFQTVKTVTIPNGGSDNSSRVHRAIMFDKDMGRSPRSNLILSFAYDVARNDAAAIWLKNRNQKNVVLMRNVHGKEYFFFATKANSKESLQRAVNVVKSVSNPEDDHEMRVLEEKEGVFNITGYSNDFSMTESWHGGAGTGSYRYLEFCFTPMKSYKGMRIKILRNAEDYSLKQIKQVNHEAQVIYGKILDYEKIKCSLYEVKELVGEGRQINLNTKQYDIRSITLQGHPGLFFLINNEPLRVGPSGVYELRDLLTINSIKVVKMFDDEDKGFRDQFILNYQYRRRSE